MGGPLSSLLADVLMERLEKRVMKQSRYSQHVLWTTSSVPGMEMTLN